MQDPAQNPSVESSGSLLPTFVRAATGVALVGWLLVLGGLLLPARITGGTTLPEVILLLGATATTLASLSRRVPAQNVLLGACIVAFVGALAHSLCAATGVPFGPLTYGDGIGRQFVKWFAWPVPFIWVVTVFNSRGVARLILRPWRKLRAYGFWLIGLTVVLTVAFDAAFEPFAFRVKHYWLWEPTKLPVSWLGVPLTNFLGWAVVTLLTLAFVTPVLINKKASAKQRPPDYHPLAAWVLLDVLFAVGAATQQLWPAVAYCAVLGAIVSVAAIRGGRW